ncbi:MAG: transglycosylase SLT domain-containing protein [archaeon]|nr:transglycosylase SLT domain-containing protein [archaeon]
MEKNRNRNGNGLVNRMMRKGLAFGVLVVMLVAVMTSVGVVPVAGAKEGKIVFQSAGNIYIINPDGTGEKRLTEGFHPLWSPDGKKIVFFSRFISGLGRLEFLDIYIMNADGSNIVKLAEEDIGKFVPSPPPFLKNETDIWFAWAPDGKKIAYSERWGDELYVSNADGTNKIKVVEYEEGYGQAISGPGWSPDGKKIAFMTWAQLTLAEERWGLFTVNPDGTGKVKIVDKGGEGGGIEVGPPSWSPDGKRIVFTTGLRGDGDIYIINADGSGLTKIAYGSFPQWSPISLGKPALTPTPAVAPTLPPTEDAFNYNGEYTLDENKLRPEEKKALPYVMKYAKEYKVSPCLIMAVIREESDFDASANGGTDVGYMQMTYNASKDVGYKGTEKEWRQKDGLDPDQNIKYGTKYLKWLHDNFFKEGKKGAVNDKTERLKFVLAAYNGGVGTITKAQQICKDKGDNPEKWDDVQEQEYLEDALKHYFPEWTDEKVAWKAGIIRKYVKEVLGGRELIDGQYRGYEFFLTIRVPVGGVPAPEKGVPGFEAIFAIAGLLAVAYLLRRR